MNKNCITDRNILLYNILTNTMLNEKLIMTLVLLFMAILTFGQETKYVNTEQLNVRSGAGSKYEVVDKVVRGKKVTVFSNQGKWSEIELENGTKGFVSTEFLSDNTTLSYASTSKKKPWLGYLFVIGLVLYGLNKVFKFFGGSSNSSSSSQRDLTPSSSNNAISDKKPKQIYICKYCGTKNEDLWRLTMQTCHDSPTKKHQPLEGGIQDKYICKYCGTNDEDLRRLTRFTCHKSPTKKHQPHF